MKLTRIRLLWLPFSLLMVWLLFTYGCAQDKGEHNQPDYRSLGEVSDFGLIDQKGKFHGFSQSSEARATVLFVQGNGCPIVRNSLGELRELDDEFSSKGVDFYMINPTLQDDAAEVRAEAEAFDIRMPVLLDQRQLVARMLDLRITAEALLIDTKTQQVIFRGPLSDRMGYESQKDTAENTYLRDAIQRFLDGDPILHPEPVTRGCAIARLSDQAVQDITYTADLAPILEQKCVKCHTEGGIAPWAMSDYETVLGWSAMIEQVLNTKRMPPWHADPNVGHFSNDLSLSDREVETIVGWLDGGMLRGEGDDPLAARSPGQQSWSMGEPDYVLELEPESIPATGVLDYRYQTVELTFDRTVYVGAVEVLPNETEVLHHVLATVGYPDDYVLPLDRKRGPWIDGILAAWAPGMEPEVFPPGTGRIIPRGSSIHLQLHYTTNGRALEDRSKIGFHFLKKPPKREYITIGPSDFDLEILPHDPAHLSTVAEKIHEDIRIFGFYPHMHYRGKSMKYTLEDPDGKRTPLLSVPNYSFNWQRYYALAQPLDVRKGSKLIVEAVFDNSEQNPFNPAPGDTLHFGEQTTDEMMIGFFSYHTLQNENQNVSYRESR